jgi:hypothetical protein
MARQEDDRQAGDLAMMQLARRLAPGRRHTLLTLILKAGQIVKARAANYSQDRLCHTSIFSNRFMLP